MKTSYRELLRQMTENFKNSIVEADDFHSSLDSLFFTAVRAAREQDHLRQFDCFKEVERHLQRVAASSYMSGLIAGMSVGPKNRGAEKLAGEASSRKKTGRRPA